MSEQSAPNCWSCQPTDGGLTVLPKQKLCKKCLRARTCQHKKFGICMVCFNKIAPKLVSKPEPREKFRNTTENPKSKGARIRTQLVAAGFIKPQTNQPLVQIEKIRKAGDVYIITRAKIYRLTKQLWALPDCLYERAQELGLTLERENAEVMQ